MFHARYDLHLHTEYSPDCDTALDRIEPHCLKRGLTGIAVTDHDSIEGALRLRDRARTLRVIVAQEVTTRDGDVIGLFLERRVKPRTSALEAMEAIHAQGGLVYLPHPFDKRHARRTGGASLASVIAHVDIVETFNGKAGHDSYNLMAAEFALRHNMVCGGGSDAHSLGAIGSVVNEIELPEPVTSAAFLHAMASVRISGTRRSKLDTLLAIGRRPFSLALRRLGGDASDPTNPENR
jgi:predicted metal-dependent phosphoesterase TrpH